MNKGIGLALLAIGIALIIFGINASESFASEGKRIFTGTPGGRESRGSEGHLHIVPAVVPIGIARQGPI